MVGFDDCDFLALPGIEVGVSVVLLPAVAYRPDNKVRCDNTKVGIDQAIWYRIPCFVSRSILGVCVAVPYPPMA